MDYTEIENSIVSRLAPLYDSDQIVVVNIPQNQAEYDRPFFKGRITVGYSGSDFSEATIMNTNEIVQEETIEFMVTFQSRSIRDASGIHPILKKVKALLLGFRPVNCERLFAKKFGFEDPTYQDGLWTFSTCFSCKTLAVQSYPDDPEDVRITQININDKIL